jgi:hypothetical protein
LDFCVFGGDDYCCGYLVVGVEVEELDAGGDGDLDVDAYGAVAAVCSSGVVAKRPSGR